MLSCRCGHDKGWDNNKCKNCGREVECTELHPAGPMKRKAVKTQEGKCRLDLLPPDVMRGIADVMAYGAKQQGRDEWDWLNGTEWSKYYGAAQRHINKFADGEDLDESGLCHLDHAIASLMILSAYYKRKLGNDDIEYRRIAREGEQSGRLDS